MRKRLAVPLLLAATLAGCPEPIPQERPRPAPPQGALAPAGLSPAAVDVLTVKRPAEPEWLGLYLVGKKAGWTRVFLSRELRGGRDVLVGTSETLVRATVGGKTVERRQREERVYEARPAGRLLSFRGEWEGDGGTRTVEGSCAPEGCQAVLRAPGSPPQRKDLGPVGETADVADAVRLVAARRATLTGAQLDLDKLRVRQVQTAFVRRERLAGAGVETEVSVVTEHEVGDRIAAEYRVADDGRVVELRLGEAIVARPEPERTARRLDQVDLFALSRVTLPRPLPRDVPATLRYRIRGLPASFHEPGARQSFSAGPGGRTVLTVSARTPAAADPRRDTPREGAREGAEREDLGPTPQIDSDHPAIAQLAREVAGEVPGSYAAAVRLLDHVHRRLEKAYGASHDRASDVLAAGKGDCTEHALLFVALARALGIPARGVLGLVYAQYEDGIPALYWHAWAEVRSGGEWIAMDPIFGQPVADATHVALGGGARGHFLTQADAVGLLGALAIEEVDVLAAR
jgi:transglutaminase-like putative cysteine protease